MQKAAILIIIVASAVIIAILGYFLFRASIRLWIYSLITGAKVNLFEMVRLRLEKVRQEDIDGMVQSIIMASKAGVRIGLKEMNSFRHAGGNYTKVTKALIAAKKANLPITFKQAGDIDLAKLDILEAVRLHITPVVYDTPEIIAKAKDGIELKVQCRVTLRANINNFIGGANQTAILARLGEGIVAAIGSADRYQDIIANPYQISDYIMSINRDQDNIPDIHQNTAYFVISIDISDVDLGENIAARLETQKAEEEAAKAKAEAEIRRAASVKQEDEMKARLKEMKSKLIEAEAEVPKAIAEAIKKGQF